MARPVKTTVVTFTYLACPDVDFSTLIGDAGVAVFGPLGSQAECTTEWTDDNTAMIDRDGVRMIVAMAETTGAGLTLTVAVGPAAASPVSCPLLQAASSLCQTIADAIAAHCPADSTRWHRVPGLLTPAGIHALTAQNAPVRPLRIRAGQARHARPGPQHDGQRPVRPEHPAVLIARSARRPRPARPTADRTLRLAIKATRQALYPAVPPAPKHHARLSAHLVAITGAFMSFSNTPFAQTVLGLF